jgi:hypothetical protein
VPKALFKHIGLFDENLPTTQDYDLWYRSFREFPFIHMPEVLIESRWHDEQGSKKINHVVEATEFWKRVVERIPENERIEWEGSSYRFLSEMAKFLRVNKLEEAADSFDEQATKALRHILVSVIIPLFDRPSMAVGAIESAVNQTHPTVEIIVVNDGSKNDLSDVVRAIAKHPNARLIHQHNRGPAAARNAGWRAASGHYVAFLDADDLMFPTKIEEQTKVMAAENRMFSHTSYFRLLNGEMTRNNSGAGNRYPDIIGGCGIATPTVMVRRSLIDEGFAFPEDIRVGEDVVLWIRIGAKHGTFGIDNPLSVVRASNHSAAYDPTKLIRGVDNIISAVTASSEFSRHTEQVIRIKSLATQLRKEANCA